MKTCSKCGSERHLSEFYKNAKTHDGLRSECKPCSNATNAAWRAAHPEMACTLAAAYYISNKERHNATCAAWYAANREQVNVRTKAWYAENKEKHGALSVAWKAANKGRVNMYFHTRRARMRAVGGTLSPGVAERLFELQRGKCACCKTSLKVSGYHLDHRMPLALDGPNTDDNIQLLCPTCNLRKGAKHPIDFMQQRGYLI